MSPDKELSLWSKAEAGRLYFPGKGASARREGDQMAEMLGC